MKHRDYCGWRRLNILVDGLHPYSTSSTSTCAIARVPERESAKLLTPGRGCSCGGRPSFLANHRSRYGSKVVEMTLETDISMIKTTARVCHSLNSLSICTSCNLLMTSDADSRRYHSGAAQSVIRGRNRRRGEKITTRAAEPNAGLEVCGRWPEAARFYATRYTAGACAVYSPRASRKERMNPLRRRPQVPNPNIVLGPQLKLGAKTWGCICEMDDGFALWLQNHYS